METVSDDQTDANSAELAKIELEVIAPLEQGFLRLDALEAERARLESEVKRAITEETAILNDEGLSEKDAVKRLLEVRARRDVQSSRLGAAERRVKEHRFDLLESCSVVRRKLGTVVYYVRTARTKRAKAIIEDLLEGPVRFSGVGLMDLVRRVKFVREIELVVNRISTGQNIDQEVELSTLRQLARQWFEECKALVFAEPGFNLQDVLPQQIPAKVNTQSEIAAETDAVAA
jgi:hypothetical protein